MNLLTRFSGYYRKLKQNGWYFLFYLFCRLSLAFGFIVAGMVKIIGERFANGLSEIHPMGAYLTALHHTGYYYTFIGIAQVLAGVLLVIPRTVTLGALLYFPIILNITVLSYAVRFDGSLFTAPLMTLANVFILAWHYDDWKGILPHNKNKIAYRPKHFREKSWRFPYFFAPTVLLITIGVIFGASRLYEVMPRNQIQDCEKQFVGTNREAAGNDFCRCVHEEGAPLDECLDRYEATASDR
ncbi:DoxX family protein [Croceiramulus getboli]|nr:DoxX family protein [Flavobacteriaceae bacterium YJPT1-3]